MVAIMNMNKIILILIITFLWIAPDAHAFFRDDGTSSEEVNLIQDMKHNKAYRTMVEERKRKSIEAKLKREKRKATLTPFVHDTPQEIEQFLRRSKKSQGKVLSQKNFSKETPQSDFIEVMLRKIVSNFLVIIAYFTVILLTFKYLRVKKIL